ncbi:hypothetical protein AAVH_32773, partial [Aphelenchoides avenae]
TAAIVEREIGLEPTNADYDDAAFDDSKLKLGKKCLYLLMLLPKGEKQELSEDVFWSQVFYVGVGDWERP